MIGQAWGRETRDGTRVYVAMQGASEQGLAWGWLEVVVCSRGEKRKRTVEMDWHVGGSLGVTAAWSAKALCWR